MSLSSRWTIWCETDSRYESAWTDTAPTTCPVDGGHTVDTTKVKAIEKRLTSRITHTSSPYKPNNPFTKINATGGAVTFLIPGASINKDNDLLIHRTAGSNTITLEAKNGETIDFQNSISISPSNFDPVRIQSDGNKWTTIALDTDDLVEDIEGEKITNVFKRGNIIVSDGFDFSQLPPGLVDHVLTWDPTKPHNIRWTNISPARARNFVFASSNYEAGKKPVGSPFMYNKKKNTTVKTPVTGFIFEGTNVGDSISKVKAVFYDYENNINNSDDVTIKCVLLDGGHEIASITVDNTVTPIEFLSNGGVIAETSYISNVPIEEKFITIQLHLTLGNTTRNKTFIVGIAQIIIYT